MAGTTGTLTNTVVTMLQSSADGVNVRLGAIEGSDAGITASFIRSIVALNASIEIGEKTGHAQYPALLVYCDKLSNSLREKFRQFSGKAHLVVEVRYSQDRLERLKNKYAGMCGCGMRPSRRFSRRLGQWGVLFRRIRRRL